MITGLESYDFLPFFGQRGVPNPTRYALELLLLTAADFLLLWWIVLRRRDRPLSAGRVLVAALAFAAVTVVRVPLLVKNGFGAFGLIALLWCDLVFAVAPAGALALRHWRGGRRLHPVALAAALLAVLFWPAAAWARFVEPYRLEVERAVVAVDESRRGDRPIRIAVLADLQTDRINEYEQHVVDSLLALEPDVVLIPGDLYQGSWATFRDVAEDFRALLARIDAPGGVYFVTGDVDRPECIAALFDGTRIRHVDNRVERVTVNGARLAIGGLCGHYWTAAAAATARSLEEPGDPHELRIAFAHHPDDVGLFRQDSRLDLFVAGHTHGGQIALPLFGPPFTLTGLGNAIGSGGLHEWRGNPIYVSRGAGMERSHAPRIRFLCRPEITLLVIPSKSGDT